MTSTSIIKKVSNKSTEKVPSIDEIRKLTEEGRSSYDERAKKAFQQAFDEIVKDSGNKIKKAAKEGISRLKLYSWRYTEDPKDPRYTFNGIKASTLFFKLKQNDKTFKDALLEYFNKDNKGDQYRVFFVRNKKNDETTLFIAWGAKPEPEQVSNDESAADNK